MLGRGPFIAGPSGPIRPMGGARYIFTIEGQLVSESGVAISGAIVRLFNEGTNAYVDWTTSGSTGAFTFHPPTNLPHWVRFHLEGSPNYFGTTDTLAPT